MRRNISYSSNRTLRGGSARLLAGLLGDSMSRLQIERRIKEHTAPLVWAEVVGAQVAGATQVLGIADGVLRVSAKSAVWATELSFYKTDIVKRLNTRINGGTGPVVVRDIHFSNRGLTEKEAEPVVRTAIPRPSADELDDIALSTDELRLIEAGVQTVGDERLRETLRRLRETDARLKLWRLENGWLPCHDCGTVAPPRIASDGSIAFGDPDCPQCRVIRRGRPAYPAGR